LVKHKVIKYTSTKTQNSTRGEAKEAVDASKKKMAAVFYRPRFDNNYIGAGQRISGTCPKNDVILFSLKRYLALGFTVRVAEIRLKRFRSNVQSGKCSIDPDQRSIVTWPDLLSVKSTLLSDFPSCKRFCFNFGLNQEKNLDFESLVLWHFPKVSYGNPILPVFTVERDRPIYWPIDIIGRYLAF